MDCELLELIRERNKLKNTLDTNPSPELKREYNRFRNYVKNRVSEKKRRYFRQQFAKVDSQSIWKTFNQLTGKDIRQEHSIPYLRSDDKLISCKNEISASLCNTFILNDDTPALAKKELDNNLISDAVWDSEVVTVSQEEIVKAISKMKPKYSDADKIPFKMLKPLLPSLIVPLCIFFTTIFKTTDYPTRFKEAFVLPLYKNKGSLTGVV